MRNRRNASKKHGSDTENRGSDAGRGIEMVLFEGCTPHPVPTGKSAEMIEGIEVASAPTGVPSLPSASMDCETPPYPGVFCERVRKAQIAKGLRGIQFFRECARVWKQAS